MRSHLIGLAAAAALGITANAANADGKDRVPDLDHAFVIVLENHNSFASFAGPASAGVGEHV
jgi:hypothetical protein